MIVSAITGAAYSQQDTAAQGQQPDPNTPLSFFLKLNNNQSTSQAASETASNGTGTKNITITVNVQQGPTGNPIELPISTVVPANIDPEDLQLCATVTGGQEMCQRVSESAANIDLSSASNSSGQTTPQAFNSNDRQGIINIWFGNVIQYADAQLISVNNTTLNIPKTVIVPSPLKYRMLKFVQPLHQVVLRLVSK
jgi:hypothetical protein